MGPLSYMWSVVDPNVIMQYMTTFKSVMTYHLIFMT
jgi:hypothetical protein